MRQDVIKLEVVVYDPEDIDTYPSVCQTPDDVERRFGFTGGERLLFTELGDYKGLAEEKEETMVTVWSSLWGILHNDRAIEEYLKEVSTPRQPSEADRRFSLALLNPPAARKEK